MLGLLAAGDVPATMLQGYPWLEMDDICACLQYAQRVVASERVEPLTVGGLASISFCPPPRVDEKAFKLKIAMFCRG